MYKFSNLLIFFKLKIENFKIMHLSTPLIELKRIGSVTASNLNKLGLKTVGDLLFYFPFRYDDFRIGGGIADLKVGETATIRGFIDLIQNKRSPRRRMYITEALINDGTETLRVVWFNQPFLTRTLKPGDEISLAGKVSEDYGGYVMTSPVYEKVGRGPAIHTEGIIPVYHLTAAVSQKQLRSAIAKVVPLAAEVSDWLPTDIIKRYQLEDLPTALREIHFPKDEAELKRAKERLGFNELFIVQVRAQQNRRAFLQLKAPEVHFHETEIRAAVSALPFALTDDQRKAAWEIIQDTAHNRPMLRLLQGDVGSGKTIVACLAAYNTALNGLQSALMVPTELLAFQHFKTVSEKLFPKASFAIALHTRSYHYILRPGQPVEITTKAVLVKAIASGEVAFVIGTHALIQEGVTFKNLALAIIDEQHRFGVEQRGLLTDKTPAGTLPHLVSMTATPIPRSLALALYGDLDISIIKQLPIGRQPIKTALINEKQREDCYNFIAGEIERGGQAFIVCPLIDISDTLGAKSVKAEYERLQASIFKKYSLGLVHGRLKAEEREKVMADFAAGKIQILVATSVIEIGVDIPGATVMMVEDADRFGLAQLHQYRGRVGRNDRQSYCFLMSNSADALSNERLSALINFQSGFDLANADLKFRGPGEVYGLEQKGFPELKMANFYDLELIKKARDAAIALLEVDPALEQSPALRKQIGEQETLAHLE